MLYNWKSKSDLHNGADLFKTLLRSIDEMIRFLQRENKLFKTKGLSFVAKDFDKKAKICEDFNAIQSSIASYLKTHDVRSDEKLNKIIENIRERYNLLGNLFRENMIFLQSNINVAEKVINIHNKVRIEQIIGQSVYDKEGEVVVNKNLENNMPSLSLNNEI